jgi:hypothetical protein
MKEKKGVQKANTSKCDMPSLESYRRMYRDVYKIIHNQKLLEIMQNR